LQTVSLTLILLAACALAYALGRQRAFALAGGRRNIRSLHSLPSYYGYFTALSCGIPAFLLIAVWLLFAPGVIDSLVVPTCRKPRAPSRRISFGWCSTTYRTWHGSAAPAAGTELQAAADHYVGLRRTGVSALAAGTLLLATLGAAVGFRRLSPALRPQSRRADGEVFLIAARRACDLRPSGSCSRAVRGDALL
jgi:phosphate transport system permease protein